MFGSHRQKVDKLSKEFVKRQERELKLLRKKLKPKNSIEERANKYNSDSSEVTATDMRSASSFRSQIQSETSDSGESSTSDRFYSGRMKNRPPEKVSLAAIKKRTRRTAVANSKTDTKAPSEKASQAATSSTAISAIHNVKNRGERLDDELAARQNFKYMNKKYLQALSKNPVLVVQSEGIQNLDMKPRVNIIEDM